MSEQPSGVMIPASLGTRLAKLEIEIARTQTVLGTLIQWIAQSAGSPLSVANAEYLLKELTRQIAKEKP